MEDAEEMKVSNQSLDFGYNMDYLRKQSHSQQRVEADDVSYDGSHDGVSASAGKDRVWTQVRDWVKKHKIAFGKGATLIMTAKFYQSVLMQNSN